MTSMSWQKSSAVVGVLGFSLAMTFGFFAQGDFCHFSLLRKCDHTRRFFNAVLRGGCLPSSHQLFPDEKKISNYANFIF